ncbi:MAG: peptidase S9, partial [Fulvivirga sp.]|nr:peptidase S9 [Fulvivirga sp.]
MPIKITLVFYLCLIAITVFSQDKWTPKEIINTKYVSSIEFSTDGNMISWTQRRGVEEKDKFVNDIHLARLELIKNNKPRAFQLTRADENDYNQLFSQDNEYLYFLSSRDEGKKLWRLNLYGGEPESVHEFENGISQLTWLNDNKLLFLASEGKTLYEIKNEKDNTEVVEDTAHWKPRRIYAFDVEEKKITRITDNDFRVSTYSVSRDGRYLVYNLILSPDYGVDANPKPVYYLKNLTTGEQKQILEGLQTPGNFQFT